VQHGITIVDACVKAGVEHVVFSSVADVDKCPDNIDHFKSKAEIEQHMKSTSLQYSILRPVAFLDNFADAKMNPLKKGALKFLTNAETKVKFVACRDIGKAAAVILSNPSAWIGKELDCASCEVSGQEAAAILSEVSGVKCTYSTMLPRFIFKFLMGELERMVCYWEKEGYSSSIEEFLKVVPDALGVKEYFQTVGKWSSGEDFGAEPVKPEPITAETIKLKVAGLFGNNKMFFFTSALTAGITAGIAVLFAVKPSSTKKLIK